jgi:hypothetical protein
MADHPIHECMRSAQELIDQGHEIYQKFTCEKCGSRQTIDERNVFYATGKCEECKHITNMRLRGCNYLAILKMRRT